MGAVAVFVAGTVEADQVLYRGFQNVYGLFLGRD